MSFWRPYSSQAMSFYVKIPTELGITLAIALAGVAAGQPRAATFQSTTIVSSAAIEDISEMMQSRYGIPVTYEDPVWQWTGDFQNRPGQAFGPFRIQQTVKIPPGLTPEQTPVLNAAAFGRILEEYNKTYDAPRYRVTESKLGLHVIPETLRDSAGKIVNAENPMDAVVDVPVARRSAVDHLSVVCLAASRVAALALRCGALSPALQGNLWNNWFEAPGGPFEWGARGVSARDALVNLFSRLRMEFSWRLRCANPSTGNHACALSVEPVQTARPGGPRISVGGKAQEANLVRSVPPVYPPLARSTGIHGHVILGVIIGTDGSVIEARLLSGHPLLAPAAIDAVKQWKYKPTLLKGQPVEVQTQVDVNFTLQRWPIYPIGLKMNPPFAVNSFEEKQYKTLAGRKQRWHQSKLGIKTGQIKTGQTN